MQEKIDESMKLDKNHTSKLQAASKSLAGDVFDPEKETSYLKMHHPGGKEVHALKNRVEDPMEKPKVDKPDEAELQMARKKEL